MIRNATPSDAAAVSAIYNHFVVHSHATFEIDPVSPGEIAARMQAYRTAGPWLVYEIDGEVVGYAYLSRFRERQAYEHTLKSSIYLKHGCGGRGIGYALYSDLLARAGAHCHSIIAGIALPNPASVQLHEKCGFKKVAHLPEVGWKFGGWIDLGFWHRPGDWVSRGARQDGPAGARDMPIIHPFG